MNIDLRWQLGVSAGVSYGAASFFSAIGRAIDAPILLEIAKLCTQLFWCLLLACLMAIGIHHLKRL